MQKRKFLFIAITVVWVAIIFWFSMQPGVESQDLSSSILGKMLALFHAQLQTNLELIETLHFILRKCAHFVEFMILGIFSSTALRDMNLPYKEITGMEFCTVVAAIDEIIQLFVSGRNARVLDVLVDSAGALVGILLVMLFVKRRKRETNVHK